jgi:hypothetical protein
VRWRRGDRLPVDARAALGLEAREQVIAAAPLTGGGWAAATAQALVGPGWRVEWADVAHAKWLAEDATLVLDPVPGTFPPLRVRLAEPGRVPETVHERVMASIVVSRRVPVPGGSVRVVGRRTDGGGLTWQLVPDGVDVDDPEVRPVVDAALAGLRAELEV